MVGDQEWQRRVSGDELRLDGLHPAEDDREAGRYLRDVSKNDRGYIEQIETVLRQGKRSDGTPLTEDDRRYLLKQAEDIRVEAAELDGATVVEPEPDLRPEPDRSPGKAGGPDRLPRSREHRGRHGRLRPRQRGRDHRRSPRLPGSVRLRLPPRRVDRDAEEAHGDRCHGDRAWTRPRDARLGVREEGDRRPRGDPVAGRRGRPPGRAPRGTRRRVDLESFRRAFAGEDYERSRAFRNFFVHSAVERAWQEAKGAMAEE